MLAPPCGLPQLAEHKRQEKTRAAESAEKLKAAQRSLKAAQEEAALDLAAAQKALSDERQAHQRIAGAHSGCCSRGVSFVAEFSGGFLWRVIRMGHVVGRVFHALMQPSDRNA